MSIYLSGILYRPEDDGDKEMSITGSEWQNIRDLVTKEQSDLREALRAELRPKGWREWKDSLSLLALMLFGGFVLHTYLPSAISSSTREDSNRISKVEASVDEIQKDVAGIRNDVSTTLKDALNRSLDRLQSSDGPSPKHVKGAAIDVGRSALELANDLKIDLDPQKVALFGSQAVKNSKTEKTSILSTVGTQLSQAQDKHPNLLAVWQATGEFINYKSETILPASAREPIESARGFNCPDITASQGEVVLTDCTLDIANISVENQLVIFRNCILRYTGRPIGFRRAEFQNCVFAFQIRTLPSKVIMMAMRELTAAAGSITSIRFPPA